MPTLLMGTSLIGNTGVGGRSVGLRQAYISMPRTTLYQSALRLVRWLGVGSRSQGGVQMQAQPVGPGTAYFGALEFNQPIALQLQPDLLAPGETVVTAQIIVKMAADGSVNRQQIATTDAPGDFIITQALCGSVASVVIDDPGTDCDATTQAVLAQPTYPGLPAQIKTVVQGGVLIAINVVPDPVTGQLGGFAYLAAPAVSFVGPGTGMAAHTLVPLTGVVVTLFNANAIPDANYYLTALFTLSSGRGEQKEVGPIPGKA